MFYSSEGSITDFIGLVALTMICQGGKELKSSQALDLGTWQGFTPNCDRGFTRAGAKLFPTSSNGYSETVHMIYLGKNNQPYEIQNPVMESSHSSSSWSDFH